MGRGARKIGVSKAAGAGGDKEMARKRAGGKAASYHEHETTLNHKTSHRP